MRKLKEILRLRFGLGLQQQNQIARSCSIGQATVHRYLRKAGAAGQSVPFSVANAGPGIFTYGQNRAVVVNRNGQVNSTSAAAHVGDVVVAYLTGGGPVKASGPWSTGAGSPPGPSSATLPVSISVGNQPAGVSYLGLTPGFVGLYQTNFKIPAVASGNHLMVVSVGGHDSNGSYISVQQIVGVEAKHVHTFPTTGHRSSRHRYSVIGVSPQHLPPQHGD